MPFSPEQEEYIGDAVYASFDGYQVWLRTGDGNNQRIALEPQTLSNLENYVAQLKAYYAAQQATVADSGAEG